jgi:hypothetical protein
VIGGEGAERAQVGERRRENRPRSYAERGVVGGDGAERAHKERCHENRPRSFAERRVVGSERARGSAAGGEGAFSGGPSVWFPPIAWGDAPGIAAPGVRPSFRHQQIRLDGELTPGAKAELDQWLAPEGAVLVDGGWWCS